MTTERYHDGEAPEFNRTLDQGASDSFTVNLKGGADFPVADYLGAKYVLETRDHPAADSYYYRLTSEDASEISVTETVSNEDEPAVDVVVSIGKTLSASLTFSVADWDLIAFFTDGTALKIFRGSQTLRPSNAREN